MSTQHKMTEEIVLFHCCALSTYLFRRSPAPLAAPQESLLHEFALLSRLGHPNVVHLYGGCLRPPRMFIVEELMAGTLGGLVHGRRTGGRLPLPDALHLALDVAHGLEYLHSLGIIHRGAREWGLRGLRRVCQDKRNDNPAPCADDDTML
jgi:serine/threonine protein kinase